MTTPSTGFLPLLDGDPDRLGPYRLVGRLGAGGMGTVYAALTPDGTRIAVKTLHRHYTADPEFRDRFAREVDLLTRVRSACAVRVLAADTTGARPWLATEYAPGPTLRAHVAARGPLGGDTLLALAAGTAEALHSIHSAGIVHRDLKPDNVVLSPEGPRVLDFGIARALDETALTRTGGVVGTPGWLAPEQYDGAVPAPAADMFSWGALIAYAATGREPFGTGPLDTLVHRTRQEEPDLAGVPPQLLPLVRGALDRSPGGRPTAAQVMTALLRGPGAGGTGGFGGTGGPGGPGPGGPGDGAGVFAPGPAGPGHEQETLARLLATGWRIDTPVDHTPWVPPRRGRRVWPLAAAAAAVLVLVAGLLTAIVPPLRQATWGALAAATPPRTGTGEGTGEGAAAEPVPCEPDGERLAAQEAVATWRPFSPDTITDEEYEMMLEAADSPDSLTATDSSVEVWPFVAPLDHDTADFGLGNGAIDGFPVATVCWVSAEAAADGVEITARFTYHPHVGSYTVHAEDFMAVASLDPATDPEGRDKVIVHGGVNEDWSGPVTPVATLSPDEPVQEATVLLPGAPERGGIAYRPSALFGAMVHDVSGHCYDVEGTTGWRDDVHQGNEGFALSDYRPEQSMLTDCPT
ncbi:serine/threonine-protein kinase [Nocardiopsis changdeensis]|uniref:Serine/threonine protein kinase n=1 Tax=Nocardiopsis changdeensis TaxID=2831969 RepID=A0ABX8BQW5_9ACTN|nr:MULTISPECIES: serine/threonine-protein kinase [Nocardiopsis]QUX24617.1 serine/threonine protein kinase [Nocardiopsis changdeensis]QYX35005.1 serine/threonine protein kinase [Nocardiopsis sp. MT53]